MELKRQIAMNRALSEGIASAYYIDFDDDTFTIEVLDGVLRNEVSSFVKEQPKRFSETIAAYVEAFVHEEDYERLVEELTSEHIIERLSKQHSYFIQYRVKPNPNNQGFFEIHITDASEHEDEHKAFMSFRCMDEQMTRELERQEELRKATERAETYARRAQENLDIINEIIRSGFWYVEYDADGVAKESFWSDAFRSMLGYGPDDNFPNGQREWANQLHPDDVDRYKSAYAECIAGSDVFEVRYRLRKSSGEYGWYSSSGKLVRYKSGNPRLLIGTFVDIDDEMGKERMESIIASMASVFFSSWIVNIKRDEIEEVSVPERYHAIVSDAEGSATHAAELLAQTCISSDDVDKLREFLDVSTVSSRFEGKDVLKAEYQSTRFGWCVINLIPAIWDKDGELSEYVIAIRGTNEEKENELRAKRALEDAYEVANRASTAKTDFLSRMSHDIRTPMNAIIGMTAIAGTHLDDTERIKDCLAKITTSSKHLLRLINEVLDMSKIESGHLDLNAEDFNLPDVIDDLIVMSRQSIEAKNQTLEVDIHDIVHEAVVGDSQRLEQAFINIVGNANKYTPEGGTIRISITEKPTYTAHTGCFEFIFEDNGIGMSEEFLKHMYEPFARAMDSRIEQQQGTGLGMPITKNIVNMMNGTIDVESEPGRGTKFTVTIFLELQEDDDDELEQAFIDLPVLVADDDEATVESACDILEELGMASEGVTSGKEALDCVVERHEQCDDFFAVILDWRMPDMDGVATARAIRKAVGDEMPIIIISAYDWSDIEEEARAAGASAFISKPLFKSRFSHVFKTLVGCVEEEEHVEEFSTKLGEVHFAGHRVLLVEDNMLNAEIANELLTMAEMDVERAVNGREAVEKLEAADENSFDVVLMDIQMPVMNGYEAAEAIRRSDRAWLRNLPIVAMTADAFAEDVAHARKAGMNGHVAKPIDINRLNTVLAEIFAK